MTLEIRVHPEEGWIAIRDRPGSSRPWAKVVPGVSLTDQDVADWVQYGPLSWQCCRWHSRHCEPPSELCCDECAERDHPQHPQGCPCVLTIDA